MIRRIKGTQDIIDTRLFDFVIDTINAHVQTYNFQHVITPIIEPIELFKRSLGQHTDVVSKEMFLITQGDKEPIICLRPEMTASTVRAFVENNITHTPWKVFSYGPLFRYERPQKGRYRQFNQFNLEVIGTACSSDDVQFIMLLDQLFTNIFKLETYALHLNYLGTRDDRELFKSILYDFLNTNSGQACATCNVRKDTNILRVFDCKNEDCKKLYVNAPKITDHLSHDSNEQWHKIQEQLHLLGVSYIVNPYLVRGLDYYNHVVFEFVSDDLGAQNAFCGGGRYDTLATIVGAKQDQPSIGAAIGLERLMLLLEAHKDKLMLPQQPQLYVVIPMEPEQETLALLVANTLQRANLCTDVLFDGSAKSRMRKANKMGATFTLLIGSQEQHDHTVMLKNMITSTQEVVKQSALLDYFGK
jgi:histidyl-tRNA synthetase